MTAHKLPIQLVQCEYTIISDKHRLAELKIQHAMNDH